MKEWNRKVSGLLTIAAIMFAFAAVSCKKESVSVDLQELLLTTDKSSVDLSTEEFVLEDSSAIAVSKEITLTGGSAQYDLKGAAITIKAAGVKIDNVKNVAEIIVDEAVGDGDFTLSNSEAAKLTINGGGANSIHLDSANVQNVVVEKEGVRLVTEGNTKIAAVDLQSECVLDSTSDDAEIGSVVFGDSVKTLTLDGKTKIKEISASTTDVKVIVASNDISVETTLVETSDGTVSTIIMEPKSDDIKVPETNLPDDKKATEESKEEKDPAEETKTYTVTYVTEYSSVESIKVEENTALKDEQLPSLTEDGYIFGGWYIGETKIEAGYKVTQDISLTAKWTEKTIFTVNYSTAYDSVASIEITKNTGLTAEQLPSLTKEGYIFGGWYIGETKIEAGYKVTQDITLTAKWTEKTTYTVNYSTAYGSVASIEITKNTGLTAEQLPSLTQENYTFGGWYIGETKIEAGYKVTQDITLTAKWTEDPFIKNITVTVVSEDNPLTDESDVLEVNYAPQEGNNNYIILTAPTGYYEYQWTFMGVTTTQKRTYSWSTPEKYTISLYPYSDGTYVAYLYIPVDGSTTGKSATIYFTVSRE